MGSATGAQHRKDGGEYASAPGRHPCTKDELEVGLGMPTVPARLSSHVTVAVRGQSRRPNGEVKVILKLA